MEHPVVKVTRRSAAEPVDVVVSGGAQIKWDIRRNQEGWPGVDEAPALWGGFVAFESMRSSGLIDRKWTFDRFVDDVLSVEFQKKKVEVDPTQPETSGGTAGS